MSEHTPTQEISLAQIASGISRFWPKVIGGSSLGLMAAITYLALFAQPVFEATATLLIADRAEAEINFHNTQRGSSANFSPVNTEIAILKSHEILEEVVRLEALQTDPEFNANHSEPSFFRRIFASVFRNLHRPMTGADLRAATETLAERITIQNPRDSLVLEISLHSSDPQKSARILETLVSVYQDAETRQREQLLNETADALRAQLDVAQIHLADLRAQPDFSGTNTMELELQQNLIERLSERYNAINLLQATRLQQSRVLSEAHPATDAVSPNVGLLLLLSTLLGALASVLPGMVPLLRNQ